MAITKHSLPRHTNLANQGLRIVAAIFDFAVMIAYFIPLFFLGNFMFSGVTSPMQATLNEYELNSSLAVVGDNGKLSYLEKDTTTDEIAWLNYSNYYYSLKYFYLNYLTGSVPTEECYRYPKTYVAAPNVDQEFKDEDGNTKKPVDYYTISWFNTKVLGVDDKEPDAYLSTSLFTYPKNDQGEYDKTALAIPKAKHYSEDYEKQIDVTLDDLLTYLNDQYITALKHLRKQNFYEPLANKLAFTTAGIVYGEGLIAFFFCYIFVPLLRKDGATFGKMLLKLGLASKLGFKHAKWQLFLRAIPFVATFTLISFLPFVEIEFLGLIALVMILVSFTFMMASPRRSALHDFTAGTIVIDKKSSIIFDTSADEFAYVSEEDGLIDENGNMITEDEKH